MNAESIKQKLKNVASQNKKSYAELFKQLTFERFLARVSTSKYRDNLIFNGGLCLKHYISTERVTKDIDFLLKELDGEEEAIKIVFSEIASLDLSDEFIYENIQILALEDGDKQYPVFRLKIDVKLGEMKDKLEVDIGVGDSVDEYEMGLEQLEYKDQPLIGKSGVMLLSYPPEFIFSEKLQTIITLKALNSRMKDYFDCHLLASQSVMEEEKALEAIRRTFSQRKTEIQEIGDYSEDLSDTWKAFRRKVPDAPEDIRDVINFLNDYLRIIKVF